MITECAARKALERLIRFLPIMPSTPMPNEYVLELRDTEKAACAALAQPCQSALTREEAEKMAEEWIMGPRLRGSLAILLQSVAGSEDTRQAMALDRQYVAGLKAGWNYCAADNEAGFNDAIQRRWNDRRAAIESKEPHA